MDTFASLALATEPPTDELLKRKPVNKNTYILTRKMLKHIVGQSTMQVILLIIFVFAGEFWLPESGDAFDEVLVKDWLAREMSTKKDAYWITDDLDEDRE